MKPPPKGWPQIPASIFYDDPAAAIDWLCRAFGFEVRLKIEGEGGRIVHSELEYGAGLIMVSGTDRASEGLQDLPCKSPKSIDGSVTIALAVFVDDIDAHYAHAKEHGAKIHNEPKTDDYGEDYWADRSYRAEDPEGHHWWFMQRLRG